MMDHTGGISAPKDQNTVGKLGHQIGLRTDIDERDLLQSADQMQQRRKILCAV